MLTCKTAGPPGARGDQYRASRELCIRAVCIIPPGLSPWPTADSHFPRPRLLTHRLVWGQAGLLVLATGTAEGPEGLTLLFVLLHGGLNNLGTQESHRAVREPGKDTESSESRCSQSTPGHFILTLCLGSNKTKENGFQKEHLAQVSSWPFSVPYLWRRESDK